MSRRRINWLDKLQRLLQTLAFSLTTASVLYTMIPNQRYEVLLTYSLCIGVITWLLIDFGRHLPPSSADHGWPTGALGIVLPLAGTILGTTLGTMLADYWYGWSSWERFALAQMPFAIAISSIPGIAATYYFYSRAKSLDMEKTIEEVSRQASESRLRLLESQLEPHMLFNTLANLRSLIAVDPLRAQAMLDHLIAYLRATLSASRTSTHTLELEFDRLQDYLELMAVRMGPRLQFTLDLPEALRAITVPALLLQPLVENSIQHGLEPKVQGGSIAISAHREGDTLHLQVHDSGLGLEPARSAAQGRGFGLTLVRERLATAYGTAAALQLEGAQGGGTRASVTIPFTP